MTTSKLRHTEVKAASDELWPNSHREGWRARAKNTREPSFKEEETWASHGRLLTRKGLRLLTKNNTWNQLLREIA
jgi:hypothetical protein